MATKQAKETTPGLAPAVPAAQPGVQAPAAARRTGDLLSNVGLIAAYAFFLLPMFIFFLFPLFWMLITSITPPADVTQLPPRYVPFVDFQPVGDNYEAVFTKASELGTITTSQSERGTQASH